MMWSETSSIAVCLSTSMISRSLEKHIHHVCKVLQCLQENRLFIKAEKCEFHVPTVKFHSYITSGQVEADPEKISAVTDWPIPTSHKQLQRFLGFANFYRKFIYNYSLVVTPLTCLTLFKIPFVWTQEADTAFCALKERLMSVSVLLQPDPPHQFVVEVDVSDLGVGAILSQCSPDDQKLHTCAFFSRKLSVAERNYDVENRELLAIKWLLKSQGTQGGRTPQPRDKIPDRPISPFHLSSGIQKYQVRCTFTPVLS